jgi:hypothetical protein
MAVGLVNGRARIIQIAAEYRRWRRPAGLQEAQNGNNSA